MTTYTFPGFVVLRIDVPTYAKDDELDIVSNAVSCDGWGGRHFHELRNKGKR